MEQGKIVYPYNNALYINLTNRCTAKCAFCIKYRWKYLFRGYNLRLDKEPTADEVIDRLEKIFKISKKTYKEVVFCGYGEPMLRLPVLKHVARWVKEKGLRVRLNTSGHGNLIYKKNVVPELEGLIDTVSVSLNAENADKYNFICRPKFGKQTFQGVLDFVKECKKYISDVQVSVLDMPGIDIEKCKQVAKSCGVELKVRPYLTGYETE